MSFCPGEITSSRIFLHSLWTNPSIDGSECSTERRRCQGKLPFGGRPKHSPEGCRLPSDLDAAETGFPRRKPHSTLKLKKDVGRDVKLRGLRIDKHSKNIQDLQRTQNLESFRLSDALFTGDDLTAALRPTYLSPALFRPSFLAPKASPWPTLQFSVRIINHTSAHITPL